MHPILKDRRRVAFYLLGWLPVAGALTALVRGEGWLEAAVFAAPLTLVFALLGLSAWYLCRSLPLEETPPARLVPAQLFGAFLSSGLWLVLGHGWARFLGRFEPFSGLPGRFPALLPVLFFSGAVLYLLAVTVHYLVAVAEARREAEGRALELKVLAREAELKALKAQIDPHFLFNCLNSINALIGRDPEGARDMCVNLAGFLRRSLRLAESESIPLGEELSLVDDYLAIEAVRFGERLQVERRVAEEARTVPVPPLLLQPLVENAIHHGIAPLLEGGRVLLEAELRGGELLLAVENPRDDETPAKRGEGIGLANVCGRLAKRYGKRARVAVTEEAERFRVELVLPAEAG